jgi:hypothetical protein
MPLRADVLMTDHPAPRDALRPGTGPAGHRSGWAPVRLGTGPAVLRPEAIDVPVGLFFAAYRYIHRSAAAQPRRGYVLERTRERRPILGRRRLSRQTRVTKRAPFLCRDRSVRILPRHASRGWSRVGTPGWP